MENRQTSFKNVVFSHDKKLMPEINNAPEKITEIYKNKQLDKTNQSLELESCNLKIVISIKPKHPVIKTLYIAEKNKLIIKKNSDRCGSRLAIGDHSSLTSRYSNYSKSIVSTSPSTYINVIKPRRHKRHQNKINPIENSSRAIKNSDLEICTQDSTKSIKKIEPCFAYSRRPQIIMTIPKIENSNIFKTHQDTTEINTLPTAKPLSVKISSNSSVVQNIYKKINYLQEKILEQEMVLRSINQHLTFSSSDEETSKVKKNTTLNNERPGCSYIEYSHIPKTAFQRQSQQSAPLSDSKATTMEKEHNSEQYGRDFTLYDNVTRRKRQSASVPCKRNEVPTYATERVHKIRQKLNPVRDYRLMDTVHYLAQGEFAPRDDGIKLTPSREAVLSDIIWEDVCRTHWPNTRLARRTMHTERCNTRSDLQNLIDSLLRERVAHIERRRRRHYRIVKLNHRHENCKPLGKIGDIIVASNKHKQNCKEKKCLSDNDYITERMQSSFRANRSKERLVKTKEGVRQNECSPGPSCAAHLPTANKEPALNCYHTGHSKSKRKLNRYCEKQNRLREPSSTSSTTSKIPRYVIKKNLSQKRFRSNEPNLEHFILLPTLVVRTPSNVKRQKKFNELYQKILNVQINKAQNDEIVNQNKNLNPTKKDIGLNINITSSESEEKLNKK